ncbi:MAG: hypothetical protein HY080_05540 [Gammaproteobacteria bacterium]|nr:hypothetical protein [Gammaproteobacteria bacterium]
MQRLVLIVGLAFAGLVHAGSDNRIMRVETAGDLYERCKPPVEITQGAPVGADERVVSAATCLSYISGFTDGHNTAVAFLVVKQKGAAKTAKDFKEASAFCDSQSITTGAIAKMVVDVLERYPEKRKLPAGILLLQVLRSAKPCQ